MVKKKKIFLIITLSLLISIGYFYRFSRFPRKEKGTTNLVLSGNVETRVTEVSFTVPGRIVELKKREGDRVKRGEVLASIDDETYRKRLKQSEALLSAKRAELKKIKRGARREKKLELEAMVRARKAEYDLAEKELGRVKSLVEKGAFPKEALDKARAARDAKKALYEAAFFKHRLIRLGARKEDVEKLSALVDQAEAALDLAAKNLRETTLLSPIDGVVIEKTKEVGEFVQPGMPVYLIATTDPAWIRAYIDEVFLDRVRPGMEVWVKLDSGRRVKGTVGYISPVSEFTPKMVQTEEVRTELVYRIRVIVPNREGIFRQGMPVSVEINLR